MCLQMAHAALILHFTSLAHDERLIICAIVTILLIGFLQRSACKPTIPTWPSNFLRAFFSFATSLILFRGRAFTKLRFHCIQSKLNLGVADPLGGLR